MDPDVQVRSVTDRAELEDVSSLFTRVWDAAHPVTPPSLLRALSHVGGMVLGAYSGGRLVGSAVGFFGGDPARPHLHSHVVGVDTAWQHRGIGTALKLAQRRWCVDRGIDRMTWTFDPLIRRNAVFNIARLGAVGVAYHPDFYGPMEDSYNAELPTDRVLVRWDLTGDLAGDLTGTKPPVEQRARLRLLDVDERGGPRLDPTHGEPPPGTDVWVRVPAEAHRDRESLPDWQAALRSVMDPLLANGYRWTRVTDDGWYVLTPAQDRKEP